MSRQTLSRNGRHEFRDRVESEILLVAMQRMPAARKNQSLRPGHATLNRFDMCERSVLVVFSLDDQRRTSDRVQILLDVPLPKLRIEPNVAPSVKCFVDVIVIARQLL